MRVVTTQYIRKPLYVDAIRLTGENFEAVAEWCQGEILKDEVPGKGPGKKFIRVRVHNPINPRQTKAFIGDWLLYTEKGYKVYTNKAFHASFNEVPSAEEKESPESNGIIRESEEFAPGITMKQAVDWLRDQHRAGIIELILGHESNGHETAIQEKSSEDPRSMQESLGP